MRIRENSIDGGYCWKQTQGSIAETANRLAVATGAASPVYSPDSRKTSVEDDVETVR